MNLQKGIWTRQTGLLRILRKCLGWKVVQKSIFDNGVPLGSIQNSECQIDSLAQSWAVISEGGDKERIAEAMSALKLSGKTG